MEWLRERIDVLRSLIEVHAQESTNRRLGRLTVLSTIFMPMTFYAGIWGMNFDNMPELHATMGYPIAISIILLTGLVTYIVFRVKGWFN